MLVHRSLGQNIRAGLLASFLEEFYIHLCFLKLSLVASDFSKATTEFMHA